MKRGHYRKCMLRKQDCIKFRRRIAWQSFSENNFADLSDVVRVKKYQHFVLSLVAFPISNISYWGIGSLPATHEETKATEMPMIIRHKHALVSCAVQLFMHDYPHTWTTVDAGNICTWQCVFLITGITWIHPTGAQCCRKKNGVNVWYLPFISLINSLNRSAQWECPSINPIQEYTNLHFSIK